MLVLITVHALIGCQSATEFEEFRSGVDANCPDEHLRNYFFWLPVTPTVRDPLPSERVDRVDIRQVAAGPYPSETLASHRFLRDADGRVAYVEHTWQEVSPAQTEGERGEFRFRLEYDDNGRLARKVEEYSRSSYDTDRFEERTVSTYSYDSLGRRVRLEGQGFSEEYGYYDDTDTLEWVVERDVDGNETRRVTFQVVDGELLGYTRATREGTHRYSVEGNTTYRELEDGLFVTHAFDDVYNIHTEYSENGSHRLSAFVDDYGNPLVVSMPDSVVEFGYRCR